jgi:hypothetical protein
MPKEGVVPLRRRIEAVQPQEARFRHLVNVHIHQSTRRNGRGGPDERPDEEGLPLTRQAELGTDGTSTPVTSQEETLLTFPLTHSRGTASCGTDDGASRKQHWLMAQSHGDPYAAYISPSPAVALLLPIDDPAVEYRQEHLRLRDLGRRHLKDIARQHDHIRPLARRD